MALKNPLGKLKDVAVGTIKHPIGTAEKAVGQAKGTAAFGRMVAGQVTRSAGSKAVGTVTSFVPGLKPAAEPLEPAVRAEAPIKRQGDALAPQPAAAPAPPAKKSPAPTKPAAKKPAAKAPAAKKAPAPAKPVAKQPVAKQPAPETPAAQADTAIDRAAEDVEVDVTPADVAKAVTKKAPTAKRAAKPAAQAPTPAAAPGDKLPVRKPAAEPEPLIDPGAAKAVASEASTLQRGADTDKS